MTSQSDALFEFLNPLDDGTDRLPDDFSVSGQPEGREAAPSVHSKETSVLFRPVSDYREFMISGCSAAVEQAARIYALMPDRCTSNREHNFAFCRTDAFFVRHEITGEVRVRSNRCGLRWCPLCIRTRRFIITQSVSAWLKKQPRPKFLTLTLKHTEVSLAEQISTLYDNFKIFKRRTWFKKHLNGGIWFFQVKKSKFDGLWHPHLHIVFNGRYLPHDEICKHWKSITKTSSVVDIRAVKNPQKAAEYVARYSAAPCKLSDLDDDRALQLVFALHGRRIVGTFGTGRGIKLTAEASADSECWKFLGSFNSIAAAADYYLDASIIMLSWRNGMYCPIEPEKPPPKPAELQKLTVNEPERFIQPYLAFY
jgi:hypothetical protein